MIVGMDRHGMDVPAVPGEERFNALADAGVFGKALGATSEEDIRYERPRATFLFLVESVAADIDPASRWQEFTRELWVVMNTMFRLTAQPDLDGDDAEAEAAALAAAHAYLESRLALEGSDPPAERNGDGR